MSEPKIKKSDTVRRYDYEPLGKNVKVTPQGFIKVPANLTKVGVFSYTESDGTIVKELRSPEEVLNDVSLASLRNATLTVGHRAMIDPENVGDLSVGFVGEAIKKAKNLASGDLTIQRKDAIEKVKSRELVEISPGYSCIIDNTPGVFEGERYDRSQTNIIYNHIALLPKGHGRQGSEITIKMDERDAVASRQDENKKSPEEDINRKGETMEFDIVRITLDGIAYELRVPKGSGTALDTAINKLQQERKDAKEEVSAQSGTILATQKEVHELKTRVGDLEKPEAIQKRVDERMEVLEKASKMAPKSDFSSKSIFEIKKEALEATGVERATLDGKDEPFVAGMFHATPTPKPEAKPEDKKYPDLSPNPKAREDEKEDKEIDKYDSLTARDRMLARQEAAWEEK